MMDKKVGCIKKRRSKLRAGESVATGGALWVKPAMLDKCVYYSLMMTKT